MGVPTARAKRVCRSWQSDHRLRFGVEFSRGREDHRSVMEGADVDVVELMEWLAEQGCSVVFKADGERTPGRRWMVIVSGCAMGADSFFRTDLASADACLEATLAHLESRGISPFALQPRSCPPHRRSRRSPVQPAMESTRGQHSSDVTVRDPATGGSRQA